MEVLTPTLIKIIVAINSYLFYWMGQIMNNHHKIISVHGVSLPPKRSLGEIYGRRGVLHGGVMIRSKIRGGCEVSFINHKCIFQ